MVWRLDTEDEVAYGLDRLGIPRLCFSSNIRDVLKVNDAPRALEVASVRQDLCQARALGLPSWIAEFRSTPRERISAQNIKDHHERFSTNCIYR
jgi:hypothetical protein